MAGKINTRPKKLLDAFPVVDDQKLRMSVMALADEWNEYARGVIYSTYNDPELMLLYKQARDSGAYQHGWKDKSHREVIRFPNPTIMEFCRAVLEPQYGPDWLSKKEVWRHELIRPWLLITLK